MQLTSEEFDEVFGAIGEYGRYEYRAGLSSGRAARSALSDAHHALAGLHALLAPGVAESSPSDAMVDHRAAAREHVLLNQALPGDTTDLARECLTWIGSYRTDLDAEVYQACVLGVLDAYRELSTPPNPWTVTSSAPASVPLPR